MYQHSGLSQMGQGGLLRYCQGSSLSHPIVYTWPGATGYQPWSQATDCPGKELLPGSQGTFSLLLRPLMGVLLTTCGRATGETRFQGVGSWAPPSPFQQGLRGWARGAAVIKQTQDNFFFLQNLRRPACKPPQVSLVQELVSTPGARGVWWAVCRAFPSEAL